MRTILLDNTQLYTYYTWGIRGDYYTIFSYNLGTTYVLSLLLSTSYSLDRDSLSKLFRKYVF